VYNGDGQAIEAVNNVAKALLNLTKLFNSQHIHIDGLLSIKNSLIEDELNNDIEDELNNNK